MIYIDDDYDDDIDIDTVNDNNNVNDHHIIKHAISAILF